jgi:hypothetical protein
MAALCHAQGWADRSWKMASDARCLTSFKIVRKIRFAWLVLAVWLPCFQLAGWNLNYRHAMMNLVSPPNAEIDQPSRLSPTLVEPSRFGNGIFQLFDASINPVNTQATDSRVGHQTNRLRRARVLLGIFSTLRDMDARDEYRRRFRIWKSHGEYGDFVCPLSVFQAQMRLHNRSECELIYSFVIDAAEFINGTEVPNVVSSEALPLLANASTDVSRWTESNDTTLLNIGKNIMHGKAQTWMKYATLLANDYDIDFVAKCEGDAFVDIPKYFAFADERLRPAPHNRGMVVGSMRDRAFWKHRPGGRPVRRTDSFFYANYDARLYVAGK